MPTALQMPSGVIRPIAGEEFIQGVDVQVCQAGYRHNERPLPLGGDSRRCWVAPVGGWWICQECRVRRRHSTTPCGCPVGRRRARLRALDVVSRGRGGGGWYDEDASEV